MQSKTGMRALSGKRITSVFTEGKGKTMYFTCLNVSIIYTTDFVLYFPAYVLGGFKLCVRLFIA